MATAALFTSGATFLIAVAAAPLLFSLPATSSSAAVFLAKNAAALQRFILSKYFAAAATVNKLLPRLFRFTFSHVTIWSFYSPLVSLWSSYPVILV